MGVDLGLNKSFYWFLNMSIWWAVVYTIFLAVNVKTYGSKYAFILIRVHQITLRPSLFPIGSFDELLNS
jgi:hypothetical protein